MNFIEERLIKALCEYLSISPDNIEIYRPELARLQVTTSKKILIGMVNNAPLIIEKTKPWKLNIVHMFKEKDSCLVAQNKPDSLFTHSIESVTCASCLRASGKSDAADILESGT